MKKETKDKKRNVAEFTKQAKLQYDNRTFLIIYDF